MSNITKTNGANIVNIKVPNLNSAEYAQGLEQVFDNINNNFQTLANHEFVKGDTGNSVFIKNELIYDSLSESYTDIGKQIKSTIYNGEDILPSITINNDIFNWDDNLKSSSINMLVSVDNHETNYTENYVSSLYFVFLDGRFINTNQNFKLGDIPAENYEGIEDLSCIIVYENGKFTKLSNAFPTIYYEKGYGLCWKLNGGKTGMPVKGLPGNDGKNAQITIVKAETQSNIVSGEFKKVNITHIFEPVSGMINVSEMEDLKEYSGISALVLCEIDNNIDYYFGTLQVENEILLANIFTGKNIISNATLEGFNNAMKSINLSSDGDSASTIKGLFIPMTSNTSDSTPVHLLTASSITGEQNTEVTDPYKNDIIFSPISDYDSITNNNNVSVKKYLYIRANYKNIDAIKTAYGIDLNSNNPTAKYNGILKYKLDSIVTTNSTDFNLPARDNVLVSDKMINILTDTPFNKLYESFTNNIKQKLDKGLYKWVLCIDKHTFDVDELLNETNSELSYPKYFNTIYTSELTPTASSTIYWFDSYGDTIKNINNVNYTIVPGFSEPEDKFTFVKFVPVHDNDLPINVDTTLNLNYEPGVLDAGGRGNVYAAAG